MIIIEIIGWGFSIFIGGGLVLLMILELFGEVKTPNTDVEFLVKEKIWEKDVKTASTFNDKFSIDDPFDFRD